MAGLTPFHELLLFKLSLSFHAFDDARLLGKELMTHGAVFQPRLVDRVGKGYLAALAAVEHDIFRTFIHCGECHRKHDNAHNG